jgi:hypothetical protein
MERAWPFEGVPEGGRNLRSPEDFLGAYGPGTEAVVIRIGLHDAQLVLVDSRGWWQRWVYRSVEEATAVGESLHVPVHLGEYPEEMRVRMNALRRPAEDFDRAAYPEQGTVGPVIPYPENRPRRLEDPRPEAGRANPKT